MTLSGRVIVPFVMGKYQREQFTLAQGQSDLVLRGDGKWFLLVTVDVPEATPIPTTDFIGVDLGISNIATDSDPDSEPHSGKAVDDIRRKHNLQRKRLQRRGTKGAKKKLRRVAQKEARFRRHENHGIAKRIVETAKRTERGIALEDLEGIRDGLRLGVETLATNCPAGRSRNCSRSCPTRRDWLASRSSPWTPETPVARVPSVDIARNPTGRAKPNSSVAPADSRPMPTRTPPGTSGLWPIVTWPQDWTALQG